MKKFNFILIFICIAFNIFAQDVEIFRSIKFCENIPFFENSDWEGPTPGIKNFFIDKEDNIYVFIRNTNSWIKISADTQEQEVKTFSTMDSTIPYWAYSNNEFLYGIYNYGRNVENYTFFRTSTDKTEKYEGKGHPLLNNSNYSTLFIDNRWFIADSNDKLVMFDFNSKNNEFNNVEQIEKKLSDGSLNKYDIFISYSDKVKFNPLRIGNTCLTNLSTIFNFYDLKESKIKGKESLVIDIRNLSFNTLGIDDNGLFYFIKYTSEKSDPDSGRAVFTGKEIKYTIAVEDIWTKEVHIYDYEKALWNPPRIGGRETGEFNGTYPWFVSADGYIYYVDGDVSRQEYQIKRINKIWYEDFKINDRKLGNINCNKIALISDLNKRTSSDIYCYKSDLVWEVEKKGEWSKIKMLTGNEGWILSKYIDYKSNEKKNNASLNLIGSTKTVKENLRLRDDVKANSKVIVTMKAGTKVKVVDVGREEVIDGIKSNWVKVELTEDSFDKDGNKIIKGTTGWCYGGYLY